MAAWLIKTEISFRALDPPQLGSLKAESDSVACLNSLSFLVASFAHLYQTRPGGDGYFTRSYDVDRRSDLIQSPTQVCWFPIHQARQTRHRLTH